MHNMSKKNTETLNNSHKYLILRVHFDLIEYKKVYEIIQQWRQQGNCKYITIANPRDVQTCVHDSEFRHITAQSGLTLPDGIGIIIASHILGYKNNGRITGPNLMLKLCDWCRKDQYRHYFYGGAESVADKLAANLSKIYPGLQVAGTYSPPFRQLTKEEDNSIVEKINSTKPDIVWVGLGAPKQEKWIASNQKKITATVMIGVGAAFDFHSGNIKWAPAWIRKLGLEWVWRFALEPKRMWRRNLNNFIFLARVIWQRFRPSPRD